ncbi:MAG: hypothetical protein AAFX99_31855 [Myxococcota bacterium]
METSFLDVMEHFQKRYGPPPFKTFRMAEQSLHVDGFASRAGLASMTPVLGWKSDLRLSQGEDVAQLSGQIVALTWWGDQIIPANVAGAKVIHAGLPFWSAALYQHQRRAPEVSRRLRQQQMREMFRKRRSLVDEESPFAKEFKDSTMVRTKGELHILYLAELIGIERLETIFAEFLAVWRYKANPYPTAQDLMAHIKERVDTKYHRQLDDFFEQVTTWRLRAIEAKTWPLQDGTWQLEAIIEARRFTTHGLGEEREETLDTPLFIGAFRGHGFTTDDVIALKIREFETKEGRATVRMTLKEPPTRFGVDPYLLLPDPNTYNNVTDVTRLETAP